MDMKRNYTLCDKGHVNQNHSEIPFYTDCIVKMKKYDHVNC